MYLVGIATTNVALKSIFYTMVTAMATAHNFISLGIFGEMKEFDSFNMMIVLPLLRPPSLRGYCVNSSIYCLTISVISKVERSSYSYQQLPESNDYNGYKEGSLGEGLCRTHITKLSLGKSV